MSVTDVVRGCLTPREQAKSDLSGYKIPKGEMARLPVKNCTSMKSAIRVTAIELESKRSKSPGMCKYNSTQHRIWTKEDVTACRPRLKFSTTKKVSSLDEHCAKKKWIPGPCKYNITLKQRKHSAFISKA